MVVMESDQYRRWCCEALKDLKFAMALRLAVLLATFSNVRFRINRFSGDAMVSSILSRSTGLTWHCAASP